MAFRAVVLIASIGLTALAESPDASQLTAELDSAELDAAKLEFFEAKIRPVLVANCYECHSATAKKIGGGLLLESRDQLMQGGESGAALNADDPAASLLMEAIRYESYEMPPSGKLPEHVIADFARWIKDGAVDPRTADVSASPKATEPIDFATAREFWSFQPPTVHAAPNVSDKNWPRRKLDSFVLARLEQAGLAPSDEAERATLIRRVTFDLTGLPPTPEQVADFLSDTSPDAYEQLIARLLGAPEFGERWARVWLDVARYAEDQAHIVGNNDSLFYPNAYLYRDWLIGAWNNDMPFDRFVRLQLAADLVAPQDRENLAALGFLGLGPKYYRRNAPEVMAEEWEDRVDTVTRGFLGLTVACARCHDHKYDPIPTEDYYALAGVFASTQMFNRPLDAAADQSKGTKKAKDAMHVVRDADKPRDIKVQIRGSADNQGDLVPRRFPRVLSQEPLDLQHGSGRGELADAIACEQNPLTARVIVNRIWSQYFGSAIVGTPSNFGKLGQRPTHPELLDDLAVRFVRSGWSLKWLHREIVLSATYRQSSGLSKAAQEADPSNELLGRMDPRRLSIEMWRDAMLAVTGELEKRVGGESIEVSDMKANRRTVYAYVSRLELNALLRMFDFPDPNVHAASRSETTTSLQKLFTLNSDFMVERAKQFVSRLDRDCADTSDVRKVRRAYELAYSRKPTADEIEIAGTFLRAGDRWQQYAQALLASNEMLFVD